PGRGISRDKHNCMNQIALNIPTPCSEQWGNFTKTPQGGFCSSCQKTVIDFTTMTDDEILAFFKTKPAHTCGRFRPNQLKLYSMPATTATGIRPGLKL